MDLRIAEKLIKKCMGSHEQFITQSSVGWAYYKNENDIKRSTPLDGLRKKAEAEVNVLRNADFRIPHNWHQLLVNQKVAYLFTYPPSFDVGNDSQNAKVTEILGDSFAKKVKNLSIEASNTGVAWLHCWVSDVGKFCYGNVPSSQIVPIYSDRLDSTLDAVLRTYTARDDTGDEITKYEIWTDKEASFFEQKGKAGLMAAQLNDEGANSITHDMGYVPFVPFYNNGTKTGDLPMYKELIDQYDLVISGFANDLADIQEVIFVLRNYGGEDLNTFLSDLKRYKAVKVEGDSNSSGGGVETMQIEIPVEARVKFLDLLKKQIFVSGQGVDPDPENFGNSSGVALKYLYSLLEIKAGLLETEFRAGFSQLLKLIFHYTKMNEDTRIQQIYIRNSIENDLETAQIAAQSIGIISQKSILQNHPWVEDVEAELKQLDEESMEELDNYGSAVGGDANDQEK
ncbi:MAG: phage portal protein [Clostridiales bacterium]